MKLGVLTGGGDVPGLNPCIKGLVNRAADRGWEVLGIRRGWGGLLHLNRDDPESLREHIVALDRQAVRTIDRTGGTVLHTSRTHPGRVKAKDAPESLREDFAADDDETHDFTSHVLKNLEFLGIDRLIPIGGDDTLSYAVELERNGVPVVAVPKTMDNDVPGTDYCIGFSTCVTRTINLSNQMRTSAQSHERVMVVEVFGRYAGYTALLPTLAGAAHRCLIPESPARIDKVTEIIMEDRANNPMNSATVLVSEGAIIEGRDMIFEGAEKDMFGHAKLGGVGKEVSAMIKELSPKYNGGSKVDMIAMNLGYLVRSGDPDSLDSIVPLVYGNLAIDHILRGDTGRMVALRNGRYDTVPIDTVVAYKKVVDVEKFYDVERYRPTYDAFELQPIFVVGAS